jgi:hypothetical protein
VLWQTKFPGDAQPLQRQQIRFAPKKRTAKLKWRPYFALAAGGYSFM